MEVFSSLNCFIHALCTLTLSEVISGRPSYTRQRVAGSNPAQQLLSARRLPELFTEAVLTEALKTKSTLQSTERPKITHHTYSGHITGKRVDMISLQRRRRGTERNSFLSYEAVSDLHLLPLCFLSGFLSSILSNFSTFCASFCSYVSHLYLFLFKYPSQKKKC